MKHVVDRTGLRFALTPLALSAALFLAACGGDDGSDLAPPTISAQPAQQSVVAGGVAIFSVTASGDSLTYQWQSSSDGGTTWTNIAGATSASYSVGSTNPSLNGAQFRVVISSGGQSVTSSPVTLTVAAAVVAPAITVDVAAISVTAGADAAFSVTASGTGLAYQWQVSSDGTTYTNVAGATGTTFTLPAVALTDSGKSVRVAVTNSAGTVNSSAAALYVTPAIVDATITSQPTAMSVTLPATATFTVAAAGTPAPTYRWQKSTDNGTTWADIAGATAASYTTAATALADSGSLFRVNVSNATATATSNPVALTVAAAAVPVAITTQPAALSVTVPATASFSVVATGSPTPTYQWQVKGTAAGATFVNINGATATSYTTPATVAADSGKQFQVVVTNGSGSVTSAPVTLTATVATTTSNLTGRAWTVGQSLETGDASVSTNPAPLVDIDDAGNAISIFTKSDGIRNVLYATRGVPGAAGTAPAWSAPVAIDTAATPAGTSTRALKVAPNGNAVVTWRTTGACTASTYTPNVTSTCNYLYSSRYSASGNAWSAPVQMADTPDSTPNLVQQLDSNGDFSLLYPGWTRTGTSGSTTAPAVLWQAAGQTGFQKRVFSDVSLNNYDFGMDSNGNMVLAGDATQNSTTDLVVYRGTTTAGFGAQELLEQRNAAATFEALAVGLNGQAIVLWNQNNGTAVTRFSADIATPTATWNQKEVEPTTLNFRNEPLQLRVTDAGIGIYAEYGYFQCYSQFRTLSAGSWSALQSYPANFDTCGTGQIPNRNGDVLTYTTSNSTTGWSTYSAASNTVIQTQTPTSVYGTSGGSLGTSAAALSVNGTGVLTAAVPYDTLPTVAQPAGDGRSSVINLWGLFLK